MAARAAIRAISIALLCVGSDALASDPAAEDTDGLASPSFARHLAQSDRLLGDLGGARGRLEEIGIGLQLVYNQYLGGKPAGGGARTSSAFGHSGSYDFLARVDFETLIGWQGLDLLLHVKGQYDRNTNGDVGAISNPIDDADFDEPIYVDQLWLEQSLWRDRIRIRAGFLEQQTLFDRNAYANSEDRQFLATFLDNNAVVPLPNGLGAALVLAPAPWLELAAGAGDGDNLPRSAGFDTTFDDIESLSAWFELKLRASGSFPGSYRVGLFVDGREQVVFGRTDPGTGLPETERNNLGVYASFDQLAFRERPESDQGLGLFARGGWADPKVNRLAWFWSLGLQYRGLAPSRDDDVLGLGTYQVIRSTRYRDAKDADFDRETGLELYYRWMALPWLAVTPDFQYIFDPGATGRTDNTAVLTLRLRATF